MQSDIIFGMSNEQFGNMHSEQERQNAKIIQEAKHTPFPKTLVSPFIFRGVHEGDRVAIENLYFDFPLEQIKKQPELFFNAAKNIYAQEKLLNPITGDAPKREIDMSRIEDLSFFESHLKVHAVTGLPELGTSDTKSIPYWDRQGVMAGFDNRFGGEQACFFQEESDIESVNIIRAFLVLYVPKYNYARLAVSNLESQMMRGQVTLRDIGELFETQRNNWTTIRDTYRQILVAKAKHLLYCLDKIRDRQIRVHCFGEVLNHLKDTDIKEEELGINLGVDGGVTADSYRPGYYIKFITQLKHYAMEEIALPADQNCVWTFKEIAASVQRPTGADTSLKEPPSYILDWRFS